MKKRKIKYNVKHYTADLGFGSKEAFYRNVKDIAVSIAAQPQKDIFYTAISDCGIELKNRKLTELRYGKEHKYGLAAVTYGANDDRKAQYVPVDAPDAISAILVKMLNDLGYDHTKYFVLSLELKTDENSKPVLIVESKPKDKV